VTTPTRPHLLQEPGVRFALATGLLVLAVLAAAAFRRGPVETEYAEVLTAGLSAIGLSTLMTSWIGAIGWAFYTGFVENDYGQLTLAGPDLARLLIFVLVTLAIASMTRRTYNFAKETAHG
jgi:hypothetical protein